MNTFVDNDGRTWTIPTITFGVVRKVRDGTGILLSDLYAPFDKEGGGLTAIDRLRTDCELLGHVVSIIIADQLEAKQLKPDIWRDSLDGKTWSSMNIAFFGAVADFFELTGRWPHLTQICRQEAGQAKISDGGDAATSTPVPSE